jgi:hypothetical protein
MATATNTLLDYAKCYLCYGTSLDEALVLAMWDIYVQTP